MEKSKKNGVKFTVLFLFFVKQRVFTSLIRLYTVQATVFLLLYTRSLPVFSVNRKLGYPKDSTSLKYRKVK